MNLVLKDKVSIRKQGECNEDIKLEENTSTGSETASSDCKGC